MTQEEKQLLIKDLCGRLPYGVKCNVWYGPKSPAFNEKDKYTDDILETINPKKGNCTFHNAIGYDFGFFPVEHLKPYLRPMSSMTKEEKKEFDEVIKSCNNKVFACPEKERRYKFFDAEQEDFMNAHHFDYRGLIEMGLALEAPEDMYKTE